MGRKSRAQKDQEEYEKYIGIARKVAGNYSKLYHRPYAQMLDIAEYALCLELFGRKSYQESRKTKKSTWIYTVIYFHMKQVVTRGLHPCPAYKGSMQVKIREWNPEIPFSCLTPEEVGSLDPEHKPNAVLSILSELGEEARKLVEIILEAPEEIAAVLTPRSAKKAREAIREYLVDELDWKFAEVDAAWSEIQECLEAR